MLNNQPEKDKKDEKGTELVKIGQEKNFVDTSDVKILAKCPRCGRTNVTASRRSPYICVDCDHADNSRVSYLRSNQQDWIEQNKSMGIDPWEQQPGETQWEFSIWCAYRDSFPGKRPTYSSVARDLNISESAVRKIGMRWTFPARMQVWMKHASDITLKQRREEILSMNAKHIKMATDLNEKLEKAIVGIDPALLKPSDIASLAKLATDLERKARLDTITQETAIQETAMVPEGENPELLKKLTKQDDMKSVLKILVDAGVFNGLQGAGMKTTTTTEVAMTAKNGDTTKVSSESK